MTTVKQYRLQKRTLARELRDFVPRTTGPFYTTVSGPNKFEPLLYVDNGQVMLMDESSITPLTRSDARELVIATYSQDLEEGARDVNALVFADRKAMRAFRNLAGNNTDPFGEENKYASPIQAFDLMTSLRMSQSLKIMTDVLKHRWWLPSGMKESEIGSWLGAPTITGATVAARLRALEKMTQIDDSVERLFSESTFSSVSKAERSLFASTNYGGVRTKISQMRDMRNHGTHIKSLTYQSPGIQEELSLSGQLSCVEVLDIIGKEFKMAVHGSTKLTSGKRVNIYMANGDILKGSAAVNAFKVENGTTTLILSGRVMGLLRIGDVAYLGESPYVSRPSQFPNKRWIGSDAYEPASARLMPADVMVAGSEH